MSKLKTNLPELSNIAKRLAQLQEQKKEAVETNDAIAAIKAQIKDLNEEIKALMAADEFIVELEEEIKERTKELKAGAKSATKDTDVKTAMYLAFIKASVKDKAVEVIEKGSAFNSIKQQSGV
jgi:predicted DNA-binding ArsR family transcriptional regulator